MVSFLGKGSGKQAGCPTKRAPDAGDSADIPSSFTRLVIFLVGRLRRPCAPAQVTQAVGRWAVALERLVK